MMRKHLSRGSALLARNLLWVAPLLAAAMCIIATVFALHGDTYAALGRDQGIFQYVGWSLRQGGRAYVDFHEINGPLPHAWNVLLQTVGGEDEHVFRTLDTSFVVLVYLGSSLSLPRWIGVTTTRATLAAWMLAGLGIMGAEFARYDWWHTNQREGFYAALVLASLALQAAAHHTRSIGRATTLIGLAAAVTSLTWFGKPPCIIFAALQVGILVLDRANIVVSIKRALAASVLGGLASALVMLAFVTKYGDVAAGLRFLSLVPLLHHTIWNHSILECYWAYDNAPRLNEAFVTVGAFVAAYFFLALPRRALLALVLPIGGFVVFAGQGKGFPYHLQLVTLGTSVAQLVLLLALAQRARDRADGWAYAVAAIAIALGLKCRADVDQNAAARSAWATVGKTREQRQSTAYFDLFPWGDFFVGDLHEAARFVRSRTAPADRIQTYGLDPYFLFLAKRRTATPVIYNFELNVDAALEGGSGSQLTAAQRSTLLAHRDATEQLVLELVERSPPAAFVFFDQAPFGHPADGEQDFASHCPTLYRWVEAHYQPAVRFGTVRVRLRL